MNSLIKQLGDRYGNEWNNNLLTYLHESMLYMSLFQVGSVYEWAVMQKD